MLRRYPLALIAMALLLLSVQTTAETDYDFAKLLSSNELKYPIHARKQGLEGWVYYSFSIGKDGLVTNAKILDSNGVDSLDNAVLDHLQSQRYEPARLNGEAVEVKSLENRQFFWLTGRPQAVGRDFQRRYKRGTKAISGGRLDDSRAILDELNAIEQRNLYEELYLQSLSAAHFNAAGDKGLAYLHTQRVLSYMPSDQQRLQLTEPEYFVPFLVGAYQYEISAGMLGDAFGSAQWLTELAPANELTKKIEEHARQTAQKITGKAHAMSASLNTPLYGGDNSVWRALLVKKEIELSSVSGQLDSIEVQCDKGRRALTYQPGQGWVLPPTWNECIFVVTGKSGTTFTLTELPDGSLAKPA